MNVMPTPLIKSLSKRSGKSTKTVERLWSEAKHLAQKQGRSGDYPYIVGILKKMLKVEDNQQMQVLPEPSVPSSRVDKVGYIQRFFQSKRGNRILDVLKAKVPQIKQQDVPPEGGKEVPTPPKVSVPSPAGEAVQEALGLVQPMEVKVGGGEGSKSYTISELYDGAIIAVNSLDLLRYLLGSQIFEDLEVFFLFLDPVLPESEVAKLLGLLQREIPGCQVVDKPGLGESWVLMCARAPIDVLGSSEVSDLPGLGVEAEVGEVKPLPPSGTGREVGKSLGKGGKREEPKVPEELKEPEEPEELKEPEEPAELKEPEEEESEEEESEEEEVESKKKEEGKWWKLPYVLIEQYITGGNGNGNGNGHSTGGGDEVVKKVVQDLIAFLEELHTQFQKWQSLIQRLEGIIEDLNSQERRDEIANLLGDEKYVSLFRRGMEAYVDILKKIKYIRTRVLEWQEQFKSYLQSLLHTPGQRKMTLGLVFYGWERIIKAIESEVERHEKGVDGWRNIMIKVGKSFYRAGDEETTDEMEEFIKGMYKIVGGEAEMLGSFVNVRRYILAWMDENDMRLAGMNVEAIKQKEFEYAIERLRKSLRS